MSLVGRVFSDRYEIQREIAQGGMAEVYLGRDVLLERNVALKALFPEYAREPSFVERFRREAQAAANLNHPNIVAVYDWGQEEGTYFIVMEHVEGRSLRDLIRGDGPIDPLQAADIGAEIASALASAHRNGVVHRDVKPGNVLMTPDGAVKVTDFGIARAGAADGLTQTGSVMGTATYFSPEQAQGFPVDGRSDLYSLGVVLYEMVTGVAPFTGDSPVAVAYKHVREDPVPPSRRNAAIPADLEAIILTAMAKRPEDRYQSAEDLRADLLRFRRGRPLAATPVTAMVAETTGPIAVDPGATAAAPRVGQPSATQAGVPVIYPPKRRGGLIAALTILGLLLVVGGIFAFSQLGGSTARVTLPDVVGKNVDEAQQLLEDQGLQVDLIVEPNDEFDENVVFAQDPEAGRKVPAGSAVTLRVSGPRTVPDVSNRNYLEATKLLTDAGFQVDLQQEPDRTVTAGTVLRTEPAAGTAVSKGSTVTLIVAVDEVVNVPNVVNLDQDTAFSQLSNAGFNIQIQSEASDTVPDGRVIRTEPAANEAVPAGSKIVLVVSTGPDTVEVPRVIGDTEADARKALTDAGFKVQVLEQPTSAPNVGFVISQDPQAFSAQQPGITVQIVVGVAQPTTTTTVAPATTTTTTTAP